MLDKAKFIYELVIEAPQHTKKNVKEMFGGEGAFIPEYREDVWAREEVSEIFQLAIVATLEHKINVFGYDHLDDAGKKQRMAEYDKRIKLLEKIRDSVKFVRQEPLTEGEKKV